MASEGGVIEARLWRKRGGIGKLAVAGFSSASASIESWRPVMAAYQSAWLISCRRGAKARRR